MTRTRAAEKALAKKYCSPCQMFFPADQKQHDCKERICACGCGGVIVRSQVGRQIAKWLPGHNMVKDGRYVVTSSGGYSEVGGGTARVEREFLVCDSANCFRVVARFGPATSPGRVERARREARWKADELNRLEREWETAA